MGESNGRAGNDSAGGVRHNPVEGSRGDLGLGEVRKRRKHADAYREQNEKAAVLSKRNHTSSERCPAHGTRIGWLPMPFQAAHTARNEPPDRKDISPGTVSVASTKRA